MCQQLIKNAHHFVEKILYLLTFGKRLKLSDRQTLYLWAVIVGILASSMALLFEAGTEFMQGVFTGDFHSARVDAYIKVSNVRHVVVPMIGGLLAALTLLFTERYLPSQTTEYMEAMSVGDGRVPVRTSLLQSLSALFSISSGTSIGKEGPLVQVCAMTGSAFGSWMKLSPPRMRLMVGCGVAAGVTAAFHTPLAACFFACEIVFASLSINLLTPIVISASVSYLILHFLGRQGALFESSFPTFVSISQILLCILLGIVSAYAAKFWLWLLRVSRQLLNGKRAYLPLRLMISGAVIGGIAIYNPYIVGNGYEVIREMVHDFFSLEQATGLLILKVFATAFVFGCGTVGGAMTPTLMCGALVGFIFGHIAQFCGLEGDYILAYAMIGMAAFFTTSARAPLTGMMFAFEFTMVGGLLFPLLIAVMTSYVVAYVTKTDSMYTQSLKNGARTAFDKSLNAVIVADIARSYHEKIFLTDSWQKIATILLKHPSQDVYVTGLNGEFIGTIYRNEVMKFAKSNELGSAVIAVDVIHEEAPVLECHLNLPTALGVFANCSLDSLPVVNTDSGLFYGIVSKSDLYQVITEIMKRESTR